MNKRDLFIFFYLFLFYQVVNAQVTIGSGEAPESGALLQVKNLAKQENSLVNAVGGVGLPRVYLSKLKPENEAELAASIGGEGEWDMNEHIGLLVYHVPSQEQPTDYDAGIYVWDGVQWKALFSNCSDGGDGDGEEIDEELEKIEFEPQSNSYIMQPNSRIAIPVTHGFAAWEYFKSMGQEPTADEILSGKVLNLADVNNLEGKLSAKIIWQEDQDNSAEPNVVSKAFIYNPEGLKHISEAKLIVETNEALGNALVAVHIGATGTDKDPVLWQWHIWVPDGIPAEVPSEGKWIFMDRYLGAVDNKPIDLDLSKPRTRNAHGLYYQWGRPTPIKKYGDVERTTVVSESEGYNMALALQSSKFIIRGGLDYNQAADWYSRGDGMKWMSRWGSISTNSIIKMPKNLLDPCPAGWRVPAWIKENAFSPSVGPWRPVWESDDPKPGNWYNDNWEALGVQEQGYHLYKDEFYKKQGYDYYAFTGCRRFEDGTLFNLDSKETIMGYLWSASSNQDGSATYLMTYWTESSQYFIDTNSRSTTYGHAIRCVKE